jgi:hypothetical protein
VLPEWHDDSTRLDGGIALVIFANARFFGRQHLDYLDRRCVLAPVITRDVPLVYAGNTEMGA